MKMNTNPYAGTKTEKNLEAAFAGSPRQETSIHTLRPWQRRKDMSRWRRCS